MLINNRFRVMCYFIIRPRGNSAADEEQNQHFQSLRQRSLREEILVGHILAEKCLRLHRKTPQPFEAVPVRNSVEIEILLTALVKGEPIQRRSSCFSDAVNEVPSLLARLPRKAKMLYKLEL